VKSEFEIRDDHIGIFRNFIDEKLIDRYIKEYQHAEAQGLVIPRKTKPHHMAADHTLNMIGSHFWRGLTYNSKPFIDLFFSRIYPLYIKKYSLLTICDRHTIYDMKLQKTVLGEGFHEWHFENWKTETRNRLMAFMVYLNDVKDGGETEFLYQKCRFKPQRNTLLIWPANYTHAHRGNPPLSNDKYILTGWIEYGV